MEWPTPRLNAQYQRLYQPQPTGPLPGAEPPAWADAQGRVRRLVLAAARPAGWDALGAVWRGVQLDLEWPAPAIAVNGTDAFELWFSLAQPVPVDEAAAVLRGLCQRYLAGVKPARLRTWPSVDGGAGGWQPARIPALAAGTDQWSAFVAPDLAAVFGDDPFIDFPPGDEAQADVIGRLASIPPAAWQAALATLPVTTPAPALAPLPATALAPTAPPAADLEPRDFLRRVMNDPGAPLALRVEAAKALLQDRPA